MKDIDFSILMTIDGRNRLITSTLKLTLVIDMTPKVIKDPFDHTRVRKQRKPVDPRPIRESLQSTHLSLLAARIPAPPSRLDPYPRERTITSRFPIDIATPLNLASDSSGCTSGPTTPTDVTLLSCPSSLPLLYFPDPFPTESCLS